MTCAQRAKSVAFVSAVIAVLGGTPAFAQVDLAGQWLTHNNEDQPHRAPGPELGDYLGFPINADLRLKAETWAATALSEPERQAQPHPAQYSMRGPGPNLTITSVFDTDSGALIGYHLVGFYGGANRTIWLDGRPHPSEFAEHLWGGFSTGEWNGDELIVTTTHMKMGVISRNGVASSPYGTMTEHFFRHGFLLVVISFVDDPIYLEEPLVRSMTWDWSPRPPPAAGGTGAFEPVEELGDAARGYVPHYPMDAHQTEFGIANHIPFEATQGGKETMYPEYQIRLQQMMAEEAKKTSSQGAARK
jgi:hypothetical protein